MNAIALDEVSRDRHAVPNLALNSDCELFRVGRLQIRIQQCARKLRRFDKLDAAEACGSACLERPLKRRNLNRQRIQQVLSGEFAG